MLNSRGEVILHRNYRCFNVLVGEEDAEDAIQSFIVRYLNPGDSDLAPCFQEGSYHFVFVEKIGLVLGTYSEGIEAPAVFIIEVLHRILKVMSSYLGVLSEAGIRRNQCLVYEVLDEMIDGGYVQCLSADAIKVHVAGNPIVVDAGGNEVTQTGWQLEGGKHSVGAIGARSLLDARSVGSAEGAASSGRLLKRVRGNEVLHP